MDNQRNTGLNKTCPICEYEFSTVSAKNKHMKNQHNQQTHDNLKTHVICPLCRENEFRCGTFSRLEEHLELSHNINLQLLTLKFSMKETYEQWLHDQKIETKYAVARTRSKTDHTENFFMCNRSDITGYKNKYNKRNKKAGGSIRIYGVCPSRLIVKHFKTGQIFIQFWASHVGHEEEIRTKHLSNAEKTVIVEKLVSGVTVDRIISDARQITSHKLERANMITRKDVTYLMKKHNVTKRKHENTMIAVEQDKGSDSVLGDVNMLAEGSSSIKDEPNEEIEQFVKERKNQFEVAPPADKTIQREVEIEIVVNFLRNLSSEAYDRCMKQIIGPVMERENKTQSSKRKLDKQDYFPTKRKK